MRRTSVLVTGVLALAAICARARAEQASVLLEAGVYAEEVVGDLDRAIETYRKIIADAEASREQVRPLPLLRTILLKERDDFPIT